MFRWLVRLLGRGLRRPAGQPGGPGESGPGEPGYDGYVSLGDEGAAIDEDRPTEHVRKDVIKGRRY